MKKIFLMRVLPAIIAITFLITCNAGLFTFASQNSGTIYVKDGKIYKPSGEELFMRGVNTMDVYYLKPKGDPKAEEHINAIRIAAQNGVNAVRIAWNIVEDPNYPELTKEAKLEELKRTLQVCRELNLSVILMLHYNNYITKMKYSQEMEHQTDPTMRDHINYLVNDAKNVLDEYKDILMIDYLNEFGSETTPITEWYKGSEYAVKTLRAAGIKNCIVAGTSKWGKDLNTIFAYGPKLMQADPLKNLFFDLHAYYYPGKTDYLKDSATLINTIQKLQKAGLPFVFGEFANKNGCNSPEIDVAPFLDVCNQYRIGYFAYCMYAEGTNLKHHNISDDFGKTINDWGNLKKTHGKDIFEYIREGSQPRNLMGSDNNQDGESGKNVPIAQIGEHSACPPGCTDHSGSNSGDSGTGDSGVGDSGVFVANNGDVNPNTKETKDIEKPSVIPSPSPFFMAEKGTSPINTNKENEKVPSKPSPFFATDFGAPLLKKNDNKINMTPKPQTPFFAADNGLSQIFKNDNKKNNVPNSQTPFYAADSGLTQLNKNANNNVNSNNNVPKPQTPFYAADSGLTQLNKNPNNNVNNNNNVPKPKTPFYAADSGLTQLNKNANNNNTNSKPQTPYFAADSGLSQVNKNSNSTINVPKIKTPHYVASSNPQKVQQPRMPSTSYAKPSVTSVESNQSPNNLQPKLPTYVAANSAATVTSHNSADENSQSQIPTTTLENTTAQHAATQVSNETTDSQIKQFKDSAAESFNKEMNNLFIETITKLSTIIVSITKTLLGWLSSIFA